MDLNALWVGSALPPLQRLCLTSAAATGCHVRLFVYEPVEGIPPGVEVVDGNDILGADKMVRHGRSQSAALFSDRFRYEVLGRGLGAWIDTDLLFIKAPQNSGDCLLGWEDDELVGSAFIWIKPRHPLIDDLRRLAADDHLIPAWLPAWKRSYLAIRKAMGKPRHVSDLDWGVIGPHLLTWLLQQSDLASQVGPTSWFSPLPWDERRKIADGNFDWQSLIKPETVCAHLWNYGLTPELRNREPQQGSLLQTVARNCGFRWPQSEI